MAALLFIFYIHTPNPKTKGPMTQELCQKYGGKWMPPMLIPVGLEVGVPKEYCLCPEKRIIYKISEVHIMEGERYRCR